MNEPNARLPSPTSFRSQVITGNPESANLDVVRQPGATGGAWLLRGGHRGGFGLGFVGPLGMK